MRTDKLLPPGSGVGIPSLKGGEDVNDLGLLVLAAAIYFGLRYLGDAVADTPFMRVTYEEEDK